MLVRDRTRGSIASDGSIRYDHVADDFDRLRLGMHEAARAYLAAGAEEVWLPLHDFPPVRSEAGLVPLLHAPLDASAFTLLYAVHLFGGAAMGDYGPCDESGRCKSVRGLYVSDASSLPSNTGVNPQVTIMANALRIGAGIVAPGAGRVTVDLARAARPLDRRSFLRFAGVAAAAGVLPSGCGGVPATLAPPADLSLAVLRPRAYATFTAAALRIVGPRGRRAHRHARRSTSDGSRTRCSRARRRWPRRSSQALVVLEFGVWPLVDKVRPFTSLAGQAQDAVLADLARSRLRGEARALRWRALARPVGVLRRAADVAAEQATRARSASAPSPSRTALAR